MKSHHYIWETMGTLADSRQKWKDFVVALCAFGAMGICLCLILFVADACFEFELRQVNYL